MLQPTGAVSNLKILRLQTQLINERLERIKETHGEIMEKHINVRGTLVTLAGKGNETAGTGITMRSKYKRINKSAPSAIADSSRKNFPR